MATTEKKLIFDNTDFVKLIGLNDENLNIIENKYRSTFTTRGNSITIKGESDEINTIEKVFNELVYMLNKNGFLNAEDVLQVITLFADDDIPNLKENKSIHSKNYDVILHSAKEIIKPKTPTQLEYYKKTLENDVVFAIGPAGTGKTFLAVAMAIAALKRNEVSKIILSRPAVEAGESLGFLPGDLQEKIDPYLKPLTDALQQMLTPEKFKSLLDKGVIEIIPLAYMRGRTLNYSFIILDEAQNATVTQMKMFLTRLGIFSKAIITGDITQIDLPDAKPSGLINAKSILQGIKGIEFVYFSEKDVIRHRLVADIIKAYEKNNNKDIDNHNKEINKKNNLLK
jgi:phosphate starvation-inducible PhoH-like protein